MIRKLSSGGEHVFRQADVLVIGAGIAGLLLATRLVDKGLHVVVLESGGEHQLDALHPLNEVVHLRSVYEGATSGRFRCLGGTSSRWGGAMIPFMKADLTSADGASRWPVSWEELSRYGPEIERLFGLPTSPYDRPDIAISKVGASPTFLPRLAKWPSFRKRNVAALLAPKINAENGPEIWLEATATDFEFAPDGRLKAITATSGNANRITVAARETVIAAGAIESTRLLLLADRQADERIFAPHDVLGRYFHDHLSTVVATIEALDRRAFNRLIGFRFEGHGMRNLRFEPNEQEDVRNRIVPSFAHIGFTAADEGPFETLRAVYRQLQQRRLPNFALLARMARAGPWLAQASWWRYREHRLLYPDDARFNLHMVIEQEPRRDNRILLADRRTDCFGQPLAAIDWEVNDSDALRLTRATDLFASFWKESSLADLGTIHRKPEGVAEAELKGGGGIYHPGGSTRMGLHPREGVVDSDLCCFGVPNLRVAATSVFPTGGGANPTMMLMAAVLRLADHISI